MMLKGPLVKLLVLLILIFSILTTFARAQDGKKRQAGRSDNELSLSSLTASPASTTTQGTPNGDGISLINVSLRRSNDKQIKPSLLTAVRHPVAHNTYQPVTGDRAFSRHLLKLDRVGNDESREDGVDNQSKESHSNGQLKKTAFDKETWETGDDMEPSKESKEINIEKNTRKIIVDGMKVRETNVDKESWKTDGDSESSKNGVHKKSDDSSKETGDNKESKETVVYEESKENDAGEASGEDSGIEESKEVGDEVSTEIYIDEDPRKIVDEDSKETSADEELKSSKVPDRHSREVLTREINRHGGDRFLCPPCKCSFSRSGKTFASCTRKGLHEIPDELPDVTWEVILLGNHIQWIKLEQFLMYPSLSKVTIQRNAMLTTIYKSTIGKQTLPTTDLDLSFNKISSIDERSFALMPELLTLNMAYNRLSTISNFTFEGLGRLQSLNLSRNAIRSIHPVAFDDVPNLRTLDLSQNKVLGYNDKVLWRVFKPLKSLQHLNIVGNSNAFQQYPNKTLQQLINLRRLSIDGLHNTKFGPELRMLKHLTKLEIGSKDAKCYITNITESFFENLERVEEFSLDFCNRMEHIASHQISINLKSLSIANSQSYSLYTALDDLKYFHNSSLTKLSLVNLFHVDDLPCRFLRKEDATYLRNLKLEELDFTYNKLALIGDDFLTELPRTLKRLILRDNKLPYGGISFTRIQFLKELIELDVSYQNMERFQHHVIQDTSGQLSCSRDLDTATNSFQATSLCSRETAIQCRKCQNSVSHCSPSGAHKAEYDFRKETLEIDDRINRKSDARQETTPKVQNTDNVLDFPPKLRIIRASYYNSFGLRVLGKGMRKNKVVSEIDVSNNFLASLNLRTMPLGVRKANLSNNYCNSIAFVFFKPNNSLEHLELQNNFLGENFADDNDGHIFRELSKTAYLDLSTNMIYKLNGHFFSGLKGLETLKLSHNKLQILNSTFSHMKLLRYLDLSHNSITWISKNTRDDLDLIATLHPLLIDLTLNPIPCTCEGLELLHWMSTTKVYILNKDYLTCRTDLDKEIPLGDIEERLRSLQRYCVSKVMIIVLCLASFIILAILVGFSMLYSYRWKLRYLRNIAMAKLMGFKPREADVVHYKFDAYFIYTDTSRDFVIRHCMPELEVKRGHKLCIDDRDFIPGTYTVSNIVSAIQNSRKTIPVVTPDFYEGDYSEYGVKMAIMEEIHKNRSVLHMCVYQPMPADEMAECHDLLMVLKRNDYTEFPPEDEANEDIIQNFWDQLSQAIGHADNDEGQRQPEQQLQIEV